MMTLFLALVFIIGVVLIFLANLDGDYEVRQEHLIDADINRVYQKISDFRSWPDWSPWLMHEPDCQLIFSDNCDQEGGHYSWDGKIIGAGKISHSRLHAPDNIQNKLEFVRPIKSVAAVEFQLQTEGEQIRVSWIMRGHMPFFFRFMIPRMKKMIGQDFKLGLCMLAGELNPATGRPRLTFKDMEQTNAEQCLCHHFEGYLDEMQTAMTTGFSGLCEFMEKTGTEASAAPRTIYHKVDLKKMHFICDMAIPVNKIDDTGSYTLLTVPGGRYFRVEVLGSYDYLEAAWYAAMCHLQMRKIKLDTKRPSLEIYQNDPEQVQDQNQIRTDLMIPVR